MSKISEIRVYGHMAIPQMDDNRNEMAEALKSAIETIPELDPAQIFVGWFPEPPVGEYKFRVGWNDGKSYQYWAADTWTEALARMKYDFSPEGKAWRESVQIYMPWEVR